MELRSGYKKTDVGVIPEDWECVELKTIVLDMVQGVNTAIYKPQYVSSGIPMFKANNIIDQDVIFDGADQISEHTYATYNERYKPKKNDFLFSNIGARLGTGSLLRIDIECSFAWNVMRIVPNTKKIDPQYLSSTINSPKVSNGIKNNQSGSGMGFVPKGMLEKVHIPVPPTLNEQKKIAAALSDIDVLIASLGRLIAKKRDMKQATMQDLLTGKRRLSGFSGEWKVKRLGEFGKCIRGVSYKGDTDLSPHDSLSTIRLLRSNNVQSSTVVKSNLQFVTSARVSEHQVMRDGAILVCMANGSKELVGKAGTFVVNDSYEYTFGAFMGCFRADAEAAHATFIFYLFQTGQYRNYIANLLAGSSINNMKPSDIESMEFQVPSPEEQTAIATILSDMDDDIATMEQKLDKTRMLKHGMTDLAKAQLKARWGTLQKVLSCKERLEMIVNDILIDMNTKTRLMDGRGNAMLVSGSIYEACKFYDLFSKTELKGKCAIVTSYKPSISDTKGETTGEGDTDNLRKYEIYQRMLADWFDEPPEKAVHKAEEFEDQVKKMFIDSPAQMKLLIVVNKLLTGFDAPSATYLYIDQQMQGHGLFQAICRVNRLDGDDKEYGYIVDYKDLFNSLEGAVKDYTSGALDGFDKEDVAGLLEDRLTKAKEDLEEAREAIKALCEPVEPPRETLEYLRFFCAEESGNAEQLKENEPKRLALYKMTAALLRSFANLASELAAAGYTSVEIETIKSEVDHFDKVRNEVKLASGDYIDLKMYEPAMRHLIDTYIRAEESEKISAFDDLSLIELIVERGEAAVEALPKSIRKNKEAVAETIENNVRKLIIDEHPINPKYYDEMSELLKALIEQRRRDAITYQEYLSKIVALTKKVKIPDWATYPASLNTRAKQALYDNLDKDEVLAVAVHNAVRESMQDDWRGNSVKIKKVKNAIKAALNNDEVRTKLILQLVTDQHDY